MHVQSITLHVRQSRRECWCAADTAYGVRSHVTVDGASHVTVMCSGCGMVWLIDAVTQETEGIEPAGMAQYVAVCSYHVIDVSYSCSVIGVMQ